MRIGFLIYGSLDTVSGGYLYDRQVVRYLESQGDTVEIISLPWRTYASHLGDNFSASLRRRLLAAQLDVLIQDELNHPSLLSVNRALAQQRPYPVIALVHHLRCSEAHPPLLNRLYRWVESRYLRSVDGFICNSRTTQATVEALAGGERPSVVAYPGGDHRPTHVTAAQIHERAHTSGPLRVLFVGNLIPRKGLHTLLAALGQLPKDTWRLDVVGSVNPSDGYAKTLLAQIQEAGIQDHVRMLGAFGNPELPHLLARSHVLAVPSQYEGFGIVYLEALAAGLPVLATTAGAAHEIVTPGATGFLVHPEDTAALAAALTALHTDRDLLARMGQNALARYAQHPTWADSGAHIRGFLGERIGD